MNKGMVNIFLSYSRADSGIVNRLYEELVSLGAKVWRDVKEITVGDSIVKSLEYGIRESDYFCLVLSKSSCSRPWVLREYRSALHLQLSSGGLRPRILPVVIDDCNIPLFLIDTQFADFRTSFIEGMDSLVKALGFYPIQYVPYNTLCKYIESHFGSLESFLYRFKHRAGEVLTISIIVHESFLCPADGNCQFNYSHALGIASLVWEGVKNTVAELKDLIKQGTQLRQFIKDSTPGEEQGVRHVIITNGINRIGGADEDEAWTGLDEGSMELLYAINAWRTYISKRWIYILPSSASWEREGWSSDDGYDFHETIDVEEILANVE